MKKYNLVIILATLLSILSTTSVYGQNEEKIKKIVESKEYKIDVNTMYPMRGPVKHLNSSYVLKVKNDSVFSYLPYYGRAYSVPYDGGHGLQFEAPIEKYSMKVGKKNKCIIKFNARTNEDNFEFTLEVFDNGSTSIDITMQNREPITFRGDLSTSKR